MSVIGTFTPAKDGGWDGSVQTLTINTKVRLVPNDNRENENAPAFRVFAGDTFTRSVAVKVLPVPRLQDALFRVTPPAYTGLKPRTNSGPPASLAVLAGSDWADETLPDTTAGWNVFSWVGLALRMRRERFDLAFLKVYG